MVESNHVIMQITFSNSNRKFLQEIIRVVKTIKNQQQKITLTNANVA